MLTTGLASGDKIGRLWWGYMGFLVVGDHHSNDGEVVQ